MRRLSLSLEAEEDIYSQLRTSLLLLQHLYVSSPLYGKYFEDAVKNVKPPVQHLIKLANVGMDSFVTSGDDDFHVLRIHFMKTECIHH